MIWKRNYLWMPKFEYVSTNQHGERYKRCSPERLDVAKLYVEACEANASDLKKLILLGHHIGEPVNYEFVEPQHIISIEVVSVKAIKRTLGLL